MYPPWKLSPSTANVGGRGECVNGGVGHVSEEWKSGGHVREEWGSGGHVSEEWGVVDM